APLEDEGTVRVLAAGPERAGDEDLLPRDLARFAGELHVGRVDRLELVLEEVLRKALAARAERVRLDQLRAGADVAEVDVDDGLRRLRVRLLGHAQPVDGAREERAHAAVGDDRGARGDPLEEPGHSPQCDRRARAGPPQAPLSLSNLSGSAPAASGPLNERIRNIAIRRNLTNPPDSVDSRRFTRDGSCGLPSRPPPSRARR